jgi:hypothetical protein
MTCTGWHQVGLELGRQFQNLLFQPWDVRARAVFCETEVASILDLHMILQLFQERVGNVLLQ